MENMAVGYGAKRIMPVAYNDDSIKDESILNVEHFAHKGRFLLIADKPIPKNSKVYMEVTITNQTIEKDIRHIPIFLGIHKEPSFGVLASDFCLGNVFYGKSNLLNSLETTEFFTSFYAMDRYASNLNMEYQFIDTVGSKVPILHTVIGLGVDMITGNIEIFTDGELFYSFRPIQFDIRNQPNDIFFAMYMAESTEYLEGDFNLGRCGVKYLPTGYMSLYDEYFYKISVNRDIVSKVQVNAMYGNASANLLFDGKLNLENDIAPVTPGVRRKVTLIKNSPTMDYYTDNTKTEINPRAFEYHNSPAALASTERAWICYPIPVYQKVYFEFSSKDGEFAASDYEGIPMRVGLTSDPNDITQNSYLVDLFHQIHYAYKLHMYSTGNYYEYANSYIATPNIPIQPNTLGMMMDLQNNKFTIYNDGSVFAEFPCMNILNDFTKEEGNLTWVVFEVPSAFLATGDVGHVICNFGESELKYKALVDNKQVMTLDYYYNYTIKYPIFHEFPCTLKVIPEKLNINKYISCLITVGDPNEEIWTPGMNKLWATYNKISNYDDSLVEHHNAPTISPFVLNRIMEEDKKTNVKPFKDSLFFDTKLNISSKKIGLFDTSRQVIVNKNIDTKFDTKVSITKSMINNPLKSDTKISVVKNITTKFDLKREVMVDEVLFLATDGVRKRFPVGVLGYGRYKPGTLRVYRKSTKTEVPVTEESNGVFYNFVTALAGTSYSDYVDYRVSYVVRPDDLAFSLGTSDSPYPGEEYYFVPNWNNAKGCGDGFWVGVYAASHADATNTSKGTSSIPVSKKGKCCWTLNSGYNAAITAAANKGPGFHCMRNREWVTVALFGETHWGNIYSPYGNVNGSNDMTDMDCLGWSDSGITSAQLDPNNNSDGYVRILTGTNPSRFKHTGWTKRGICNLIGNIWEFVDGLQLRNGIPYAFDANNNNYVSLGSGVIDSNEYYNGNSGPINYINNSTNDLLNEGLPVVSGGMQIMHKAMHDWADGRFFKRNSGTRYCFRGGDSTGGMQTNIWSMSLENNASADLSKTYGFRLVRDLV